MWVWPRSRADKATPIFTWCTKAIVLKMKQLLLQLLVVSLCAVCSCRAVITEPLVTEQVFLDLEVQGERAGRVVIGLFGATSPKTVRNFVALANHEVRQ